ncbi:mannose-6-phosphate isomerase, class I [Borrelia anserina]|uniref:mannose-6-phosphate isomerase n=2 Tax=Borrelia anserina TaxID=143 RepID=W5SNE5_BORAN|nr:mannose-6-phosphate isomerase, class I [Borrelia anserina]AHH08380.1 Mannose-6-phosphate isomerase [Borrelia anserina BA2]APR64870.1 mannose-6-phosphate isomerase [Borrelia anserina Es]UPA06789.1 mannose-6-phosphate isomerase, class I [Borrelia anserina]
MRVDNIFLMRNEIKEYDWGGISFIPYLLGQREDGLPKAEMWLGAHKTFSSKILVDGQYIALCDFLENYDDLLGCKGELPFLFKVLSAQRPLSIQIHPSKETALKGFELENVKGIGINDFERIYKDQNPKVELVYALSDFYALKGFLPLFEIISICRKLKLDFHFTTHKEFIRNVFSLQKYEIENAISKIKENLGSIDDFRAYWFNEIHKIYGVDIGLLVFLGMRIFKLNPGEVLYTESQEVHAYLKGECLELMTNSDNVIRAGLTTKYIDKDEMLKVGKFEEGMVSLLRSENIDGFNVFKLPGTDLSLLQRNINEKICFKQDGVMILLVMNGKIQINNKFFLKKGESVFIRNFGEELLICGEGEIFIALSL